MSATYRWKSGFSPGVAADAAGPELERIRAEQGVLRPGDVVAAARPEESPLHAAFSWDDSEAAEQWRQQEARRLLSGIRIVMAGNAGQKPILAVNYVSVLDRERGRGYQPIGDVMGDAENRTRLLLEARQQLEGFVRRYQHLEELAAIIAAIHAVNVA